MNSRENFTMNSELLNRVLFELDPARTGCKENEMFDEYETISVAVCDMVNIDKADLPYALVTVFDVMFWKGFLSTDALDNIVNRYGIGANQCTASSIS